MILNKKNLKDLYPESLAGEIDKNLKLYLNDYKHVPAGLRDAIEYSLLNGGKRLRPVLCLATAKSIGCRIPGSNPDTFLEKTPYLVLSLMG